MLNWTELSFSYAVAAFIDFVEAVDGMVLGFLFGLPNPDFSSVVGLLDFTQVVRINPL